MSTASTVTSSSARTVRAVSGGLEEDVEIGSEVPPPLTEEESVRGIGDVAVERLRVEMVGQIEAANRESKGVFRADFDIFRNSCIQGKKGRVTVGVRNSDEVLRGVGDSVRES